MHGVVSACMDSEPFMPDGQPGSTGAVGGAPEYQTMLTAAAGVKDRGTPAGRRATQAAPPAVTRLSAGSPRPHASQRDYTGYPCNNGSREDPTTENCPQHASQL